MPKVVRRGRTILEQCIPSKYLDAHEVLKYGSREELERFLRRPPPGAEREIIPVLPRCPLKAKYALVQKRFWRR